MLDDLGNGQRFPALPAGAAALTGGLGIAKGFADGAGISPKPVGADQQRTPSGTAADAAQQAAEQSQVPLLTALPSPPQP
jgi:hypothetical protein